MLDPIPRKFSSIVFRFIQSNNVSHAKMLKNLDVVVSAISLLFLAWGCVDRAHKGNELVGNDPVKVPILYFLIILIFFVVELFEVIPSKANCKLQTFQAVVDCALIGAGVAVAGVAERLEDLVVR